MKQADFAYSRTYQIGPKHRATFRLEGGQLSCEWDPDLPKNGPGRKILGAYREARSDFLKSTGLDVMVVEL